MSHLSRSLLPSSVPRLVGSVLAGDPWPTTVFLVSAVTHAAAHGALAWTAGQLARSLTSSAFVLLDVGPSSPATIAFLGLVIAMIKGGAGVAATRHQTRLAAVASETIRDRVVTRLLDHGLSAPSPLALARVSSRVREVADAVQDGVLASARSLAQLVPIAVALMLLSPSLTLVAAGVIVPFGWFLSRARKSWRKDHERFLTASDELQGEMDDLIRHADLWRTYGTGHRVRQQLHRLARDVTTAQMRAETLRAVLSSSNEVLGALALLLALVAGARWASHLPAGTIVAFAAVFFMAYKPLRDLGDARTFLARGDDALASLDALSRETHRHADTAGPPVSWPQRSIVVRDVFVQGQSAPISFDAAPGEMVAIAGPTGIGKSTLLRSLLGLEPASCGVIQIDGRPLRPGVVGPAERPFAWVPQDAPVISGTLDDNFLLAGTTETDANRELDALGASFLRSALAGMKLGASGRTLSGGERRWLAVARALATRLPVLLLDEPSVGLDAAARQRLLDTLQSLRGQRTVIVVSHDNDIIALADRVVWMNQWPRRTGSEP